jgi:hypothetical protein
MKAEIYLDVNMQVEDGLVQIDRNTDIQTGIARQVGM